MPTIPFKLAVVQIEREKDIFSLFHWLKQVFFSYEKVGCNGSNFQ